MSENPSARGADQKYRLGNIVAQASSLSLMLFGNGGEAFRAMGPYQQDNVLWLLSDLLNEMDGLVNGGSS